MVRVRATVRTYIFVAQGIQNTLKVKKKIRAELSARIASFYHCRNVHETVSYSV